jgi:hypothetical protein
MLPWDEELETYECTAFHDDSLTFTYCSEWTTFEDSADEWETGSCACTSTELLDATGEPLTYCQEWRCEQKEISKCDGNEPNDWPYFCYECDEDDCWQVGPTIEIEFSHCMCDLASVETTSGFGGIPRQQCTAWHCTEGNEHSGGQAAESEAYYAHERNGVGTVTTWSGRMDSIEEFERAECHCSQMTPDESCCVHWECVERGLHYHYPYPLAIIPHVYLMPIFVGVVHTVGTLVWLEKLECCGNGNNAERACLSSRCGLIARHASHCHARSPCCLLPSRLISNQLARALRLCHGRQPHHLLESTPIHAVLPRLP